MLNWKNTHWQCGHRECPESGFAVGKGKALSALHRHWNKVHGTSDFMAAKNLGRLSMEVQHG